MKFISSVPIVTVASLTMSCVPFYYAPNSQNVPMLKEKGEGIVGFAADLGSKKYGAEFNTAVAISDHIAVTTQLFVCQSNENILELDLTPSHTGRPELTTINEKLNEVGIGYFTKLKNEDFVFELYSGGGTGKIDIENDEQGSVSSRFYRFYMQPSLSYINSQRRKEVSFSISSRFAQVNYYNLSAGFKEDTKDKSSLLLAEPAFTFVIGPFGKVPLKIRFQHCLSFRLNNFPLYTERHALSIGLFFWLKPRSER